MQLIVNHVLTFHDMYCIAMWRFIYIVKQALFLLNYSYLFIDSRLFQNYDIR